MELAYEMCQFFDNVLARQSVFIGSCESHGMPFAPSEIVGTRFTTDSEMRCNGYIYCLGEIKVEMGSGKADSIIQVGNY
jgi:hypothetical protein